MDYIFSISTELNAVLGQYELFKDRNSMEYLVWIIGNGDPMHAQGVYATQYTSRMRTAKVK